MPDFRYHLGLAYLKVGRARQAARELEAALGMMGLRRSTRVKEPMVLVSAAVAYMRMDALPTARARAELAAERDPDSAEPRYVLGLIAKQEGHEEEAVARFQETLERDRDHPDANVAVADWLEREGRPEEAREHLRHASHGTPKNFEILMALGGLAYRQEDWGEAAEAFSLALRARPESEDAAYNLGTARLAEGRRREAVEILRTLVERDEPHEEAAFNLGRALHEMERYEDAVSVFRGMLERGANVDVAGVRFALALALESLGDDEAAEVAYRKVVEESPDFLPAFLNLASLLARTSRIDEAVEVLESSLDVPMDEARREAIRETVREFQRGRIRKKSDGPEGPSLPELKPARIDALSRGRCDACAR